MDTNKILDLVNEQAENKCLWFVSRHASEEYLQKALRDLHRVIEDNIKKYRFCTKEELTNKGYVFSKRERNGNMMLDVWKYDGMIYYPKYRDGDKPIGIMESIIFIRENKYGLPLTKDDGYWVNDVSGCVEITNGI